ncbi:hypothetical protein KAI23_05360, partial [Candidatus Bathyarchaeota archaeon]|nr:hypothetical protein [Candidatus Bathyarchaeota archaeon]
SESSTLSENVKYSDFSLWGILEMKSDGFCSNKEEEVNKMKDEMTRKQKDDAIFWGIIGLIILVSASIWLGKELGWWHFDFPFWPMIAI